MLLQKRKTKKRVLQKSVMLLQLTTKTKKEALQSIVIALQLTPKTRKWTTTECCNTYKSVIAPQDKKSTTKCCDAIPRSTAKCCNSITP